MKLRYLLVIGLALFFTGCGRRVGEEPGPELVEQQEQIPTLAQVVIDDGEQVATYPASLSEGVTALAVTEEVLRVEGVELGLKEYGFGVLVEAIGGKQNGADRAWIYYVNGQAATVGAGELKVQAGDQIMWKYEKPIY